jgi:hypothetical protein
MGASRALGLSDNLVAGANVTKPAKTQAQRPKTSHNGEFSLKFSKVFFTLPLCLDHRKGVPIVTGGACAPVEANGPLAYRVTNPLIPDENAGVILVHVNGRVIAVGVAGVFPIDEGSNGRTCRNIRAPHLFSFFPQ